MLTLSDIMADVSGASFIGMDTVTTPVLKGGKGNPMQGRIQKHMDGASVMVFQNKKSHGYDNMVKRRLEKEGKDPESFELSPRKWGERVDGLPIVKHNGAEYLEVIFLNAGTVRYTLDGQPVDHSDIEGLKTAETASQGGLDDKVIIRTFKADSIKTLRVDGQTINL